MSAAQSTVFTIAISLRTWILTSGGRNTMSKLSRANLSSSMRASGDRSRQPSVKPAGFVNGIYTPSTLEAIIFTLSSIGSIRPERALTAFKANATRQMRQDGCWQYSHSPWAEKGSKRYLWNERSVARAIEYVLYGQGDELPDFDD